MELEKTSFLSLPRDQQRSAVEALIFASDEPLSPKNLYKLLVDYEGGDEISDEDLAEISAGDSIAEPGSAAENDSPEEATADGDAATEATSDAPAAAKALSQTEGQKTTGTAEAKEMPEQPRPEPRKHGQASEVPAPEEQEPAADAVGNAESPEAREAAASGVPAAESGPAEQIEASEAELDEGAAADAGDTAAKDAADSTTEPQSPVVPEAADAAADTPTPVSSNGVAGRQENARLKRLQARRRERRKKVMALFVELVEELNRELEEAGRVFRVVKVAGGYQFATHHIYGELVARLVKSKSKRRLSNAALETLAIIAYRQPISKVEIESIRGVNSGEVVKKLLEKNLVTISGRSDAVGRPLLYGTTDDFLRAFGLHKVTDLPKPRELQEILADSKDDMAAYKTVILSEKESAEKIEEKLRDMAIPRKDRQAEAQSAGPEGEAARGTADDSAHVPKPDSHEDGQQRRTDEPQQDTTGTTAEPGDSSQAGTPGDELSDKGGEDDSTEGPGNVLHLVQGGQPDSTAEKAPTASNPDEAVPPVNEPQAEKPFTDPPLSKSDSPADTGGEQPQASAGKSGQDDAENPETPIIQRLKQRLSANKDQPPGEAE